MKSLSLNTRDLVKAKTYADKLINSFNSEYHSQYKKRATSIKNLLESYQDYGKTGGSKVWATAEDGSYGYVYNDIDDIETLTKNALSFCQKYAEQQPCHVIDVNGANSDVIRKFVIEQVITM